MTRPIVFTLALLAFGSCSVLLEEDWQAKTCQGDDAYKNQACARAIRHPGATFLGALLLPLLGASIIALWLGRPRAQEGPP